MSSETLLGLKKTMMRMTI